MPTEVYPRAARARRKAVAALAAVATLALAALPFAAAAPAEAASELKLVCPDGKADPFFKNTTTGKRVAITDKQHKALAQAQCNAGLDATADETTTVNIVNNQNNPILVSYNDPTNISWGAGCTTTGSGATIAVGKTCVATVNNDNISTRFCAVELQDTSKLQPMKLAAALNCDKAQNSNLTLVETIFQPSSAGGCFNKGSCVWFDISVIPLTCTDALWAQNQCANAGGASYNLPVSVSCGAQTVYTCQGPQTNEYGPANYPSNCGNPNAVTQGGPNGQNAYFYPMFDPPENAYQPNTVCLSGQALTVTFLAGQ